MGFDVEIGWTRELAARLASDPKSSELTGELPKLDALEKRLQSAAGQELDAAAAKRLYLAVRQVKRRIMLSGVGHHDWWSGSIGIIDPIKGFNFPNGLTQMTVDRPWPECSRPPVDPRESPGYHTSGNYTGYKTAYPLAEHDFLVSARATDGKFRLYLMDTDGNRELIYEGAYNVLHAMPLKPRPAPPRQLDRVAWPGTGKDRQPAELGVFYNPDVYEGVPELQRGTVNNLRVWQLDHKTYTTWAKTFRHSGPPVSIVQEEGVKRVPSIVPVEPDGSVYFKVPPGRSVYFQLLDEHYRCLHTMRSVTGVLPGERRSCVGCHEMDRSAAHSRASLALGRAPTELSPPPWGTESIRYERFAQPVLDRYCGKCHQGDGDARSVLDLTLRDPDFAGIELLRMRPRVQSAVIERP